MSIQATQYICQFIGDWEFESPVHPDPDYEPSTEPSSEDFTSDEDENENIEHLDHQMFNDDYESPVTYDNFTV